jgi:hypothetical protein
MILALSKGPMDDSIERAKLEELLTADLRKMEPGASSVKVSFDCRFAIHSVGDRHTLRNLSKAAKKYLSEGGPPPTELLDD